MPDYSSLLPRGQKEGRASPLSAPPPASLSFRAWQFNRLLVLQNLLFASFASTAAISFAFTRNVGDAVTVVVLLFLALLGLALRQLIDPTRAQRWAAIALTTTALVAATANFQGRMGPMSQSEWIASLSGDLVMVPSFALMSTTFALSPPLFILLLLLFSPTTFALVGAVWEGRAGLEDGASAGLIAMQNMASVHFLAILIYVWVNTQCTREYEQMLQSALVRGSPDDAPVPSIDLEPPIASLRLEIDASKTLPPLEAYAAPLARMEAAVQMLEVLAKTSARLTRLPTGAQLHRDPEIVEVATLLSALEEMAGVFKRPRTTQMMFCRDVADDAPPHITVDSAWLLLFLVNFLRSALHHSRHGCICFGVEMAAADAVRFSVAFTAEHACDGLADVIAAPPPSASGCYPALRLRAEHMRQLASRLQWALGWRRKTARSVVLYVDLPLTTEASAASYMPPADVECECCSERPTLVPRIDVRSQGSND